jgi:hypothetical protein
MQTELFHEDIYDALGTIGDALGGPKRVGGLLWPKLSPANASQKFRDCCNREKREKFDPEEIELLLLEGRKVGCHAGMYYLADACDYERPPLVEPESAMVRLQHEMMNMSRAHMDMIKRFERLMALHNDDAGE